jgi:hypothetical protein
VELAKTPVDGKGLGLRAAYTHIDVPGGTLVDPTVHVQVDYTTSATWAVHGLYHDDSVRPKPEVSGAVQVPLFGGALGLNYSEYVLDPVTQIVRLSRIYGAEVSRPIAWGLTGKVGYQYLDSLAGDSLTGRTFQVALGGESRTIGRLDLQYQTAQMRAPMGRLPDTSSLAITLTRPLGSLGDIALTGRRTVAAPGTIPLPTDNQFQLDVKRAF